MKIKYLVPLIPAALLYSTTALSQSGFVSTWAGLYPGSTSGDDGSCQLCHASSTQNLNAYGAAICSSGAGSISNRILDVEGLDSDADPTGSNNFTEIDANSQPGWTPGGSNLIFSRGNCAATGTVESPPSFIGGLLDPAAANQPPVADANGPYTGTVNVALTFDGTASSDIDGTIVAYNWEFGDGTGGSSATPTHTYLTSGTFMVSLTVTDDFGATGTVATTASIGLGNLPPIANPSGPYNGTVDTAVAFDGTQSSDPDGSIISYSWDFGDGTSGTGATPSHAYTAANTYNVILTVMDDAGATDSLGTTATITAVPVNQPPVADANGPYSGTTGTSLVFDGSASSDSDGSIVSYSWDFGDGNTGTGVTPAHTYTANGNYTVSLTVTDNQGATGLATSTASIGSVSPPPIADPNGPYAGTVGISIVFDGSASNDPDGTILSYDWDFGDGNTATGVSPAHTYMAAGNYTVTLVVTDDAGNIGAATTNATIGTGNMAPTADANGPYSGTVGVAVMFDGTASFDPDGTITAYSWDFGDGATASGANPTHSYTAAGMYNVTLIVTDDAGTTDSIGTTANITVVGGGNGDDDDDDHDDDDDDDDDDDVDDDDDDDHKDKKRNKRHS